jgi:hypothetical protein
LESLLWVRVSAPSAPSTREHLRHVPYYYEALQAYREAAGGLLCVSGDLGVVG